MMSSTHSAYSHSSTHDAPPSVKTFPRNLQSIESEILLSEKVTLCIQDIPDSCLGIGGSCHAILVNGALKGAEKNTCEKTSQIALRVFYPRFASIDTDPSPLEPEHLLLNQLAKDELSEYNDPLSPKKYFPKSFGIGKAICTLEYDNGDTCTNSFFCHAEEYVPYNLNNLLQRRKHPYPVAIIQTIIKNLVQALSVAHKNNRAHFDLSIANIGFSNEKASSLKLIDWGLSKKITSEVSKSTYIGTALSAAAPESLNKNSPDTKADIFAIGLLIYQLATRSFLFTSTSKEKLIIEQQNLLAPSLNNRVLEKIQSNKNTLNKKIDELRKTQYQLDIQHFRTCPPLVELFEACIQYDPKKRPSCDELLDMPFLKDRVDDVFIAPLKKIPFTISALMQKFLELVSY